MYRTTIIVLALFVVNSLQKVQFHQEESALSVRSRFFNEVFHRYYQETGNIFVFTKNPNDLGRFLPPIPLVLMRTWETLMKAMSKKVGSLVVILDGDTPDQNSYDLERLRGVQTRFPVLVVCNDATACSSEVYLKKIAESTNSSQLHYAILYRGGLIEIYKRTETAEGSCGIPRMVRISYNGSTAWPNDDTFSKTVNYNKCPIRLVTLHYPSQSQPCTPGDTDHFCGMEGDIVKFLVDKINATAVTTVWKDEDEVKNFVAMELADLGYGALHIDGNEALVYLSPTMFTKRAIIVPHSASIVGPSIWTIALPLNREVWIGFIVVIVSIFIMGRIIPYFRRLNALQQFGTILGIGVPIQPRQFPQRIYFFSIVLFGFVFTQVYLVNLTKIYSTSNPYRIKTLEELEESGLRVYGGDRGKELVIEFGFPGIVKNFEVVSTDILLAKFLGARAGRSSDAIYVQIDTENLMRMRNVEIMEETASLNFLAFAAPTSSSLMEIINELILIMWGHRIMNQFSMLKLITDSGFSDVWWHGVSMSGSRNTAKLSLTDLQGVFVLLAVGLSLSIVIFIVEYAVKFIMEKLESKRQARGPFA